LKQSVNIINLPLWRNRAAAGLLLLSLLGITGCGGGDGTPVVASYNGHDLTQKQLLYHMPKGVKGEDSTLLADLYIQQWLKEQAICDAALAKIENLEEEIAFKVEDDRRKHILHEFTTRLVSDSLKLEIPEAEIENYYNENRDKFIAKENSYSYFYISTHQIQTTEVAKWMRSANPEDLEKLSQWAEINALDYKLDSTFEGEQVVDELTKGYFGNLKKSETGKLIRWNTVIMGQKNIYYFFKKLSMAQAGEPKPLNLIKEEIKTAILNERKIALYQNAEERILHDARPNFTINR
jgi:PPIC-type PPIASE domain